MLITTRKMSARDTKLHGLSCCADPEYLEQSMKADYELAERDALMEELYKEEVSLAIYMALVKAE